MLEKSIRKVHPSTIFMGFCVGVILISIFSVIFRGRSQLEPLFNENVTVHGEIKADPNVDESGTTKLKLEVLQIKYSSDEYLNLGKNRPVIYLTVKTREQLERGEILTISGKLSEGFGRYSGAIYQGEFKEIARPEHGSLLLRLRGWLAERVQRFLGEENSREARLGLAYLLGMKNGLDSELLEILSLVGLSHLVVASGTHLGILAGFFKKTFGKLSKFAGAFFSLIFIVLFGTMIGWTASITRAAIVAGISLLAEAEGRKIEAWRIIVVAMAITLVIDSTYVLDLGWLLSFGSFIGILLLAPRMVEFFYGKPGAKGTKKPNFVAETVLVTIAATAMCAPILLYYFGSLSLISVVANLLILPTVPIVMGLTFISGLVGFIPGTVFFTALSLKYHLFVMEFFAKQTSFLIQIPSGKTGVFLLYIPILAPFIFGTFVCASKKLKMRREFEKNFQKRIRLSA